MEPNQSQHNDDGNSNMKNVPSSRSYPNDRRPDYRYDAENNPSKYVLTRLFIVEFQYFTL